MSTTTAVKLAAGDEVVLARISRFGARAPEFHGTGRVTKAGRRYAVAQINGHRSYEFDMETGYERGDGNGNGLCVVTRARFEMERDTRAAEIYLREHGLEWNRRGLTAEQLVAVADLVRSFDPETSKEQDR